MRLVRTLIATVLLALPLAAQTGVHVADVLLIDVGLGYGGISAHLPRLDSDWKLEDSRKEPGLELRLSRYPLHFGSKLTIKSQFSSWAIEWTAPHKKRHEFSLIIEESRGYLNTSFVHSTSRSALWSSANCFNSPLDYRGFPYVPANHLQLRYWVLIPRLPADSEERDETSPPVLPETISFDDVIKIATEHHARTGSETSKDFLRGIARFIPLETEIETSSLMDFLSSLTLPAEMGNFASDPFQKMRGLRQAMKRDKDSLAIRAHQALVRSKRDTEFPNIDLEQMGGEDYAVYRQMVENGVFEGSQRSKALNMLLDCSADLSAHPMWMDLVASPDFKIPANEKNALLRRLKGEVSARKLSTLIGLAVVNLIGLGALILLLRFICGRIMFR